MKPRRPVAFAHAGDGSGRLFIVSEYGQVQFLAGPDATELVTFLDIEPQVDYKDKENEEGLLGLAFHPKYKENGEFFVYYTVEGAAAHVGHLAVHGFEGRPEQGRSDERRSAAHDSSSRSGTTTAGPSRFGPDGYLYIGLGDGGTANDPYDNGQNLEHAARQDPADRRRPQGRRQDSTRFPKDNPFVGKEGASAGDLRATASATSGGCRSIAKTGHLWVGDVGQNLWEEIDIVDKGATTAGTSARGFTRSMWPTPSPAPAARRLSKQARSEGWQEDLIEPIWEYHHDTSASRSPAATSIAARRCRSSRGTICTPTT